MMAPKPCPCGIDHWLHVALGFQGLVGMLTQLQQQGITCTPAALAALEVYQARLAELIRKAKET
jgi:hypothetical protein